MARTRSSFEVGSGEEWTKEAAPHLWWKVCDEATVEFRE